MQLYAFNLFLNCCCSFLIPPAESVSSEIMCISLSKFGEPCSSSLCFSSYALVCLTTFYLLSAVSFPFIPSVGLSCHVFINVLICDAILPSCD